MIFTESKRPNRVSTSEYLFTFGFKKGRFFSPKTVSIAITHDSVNANDVQIIWRKTNIPKANTT